MKLFFVAHSLTTMVCLDSGVCFSMTLKNKSQPVETLGKNKQKVQERGKTRESQHISGKVRPPDKFQLLDKSSMIKEKRGELFLSAFVSSFGACLLDRKGLNIFSYTLIWYSDLSRAHEKAGHCNIPLLDSFGCWCYVLFQPQA